MLSMFMSVSNTILRPQSGQLAGQSALVAARLCFDRDSLLLTNIQRALTAVSLLECRPRAQIEALRDLQDGGQVDELMTFMKLMYISTWTRRSV